jgi:hypothetical protein
LGDGSIGQGPRVFISAIGGLLINSSSESENRIGLGPDINLRT